MAGTRILANVPAALFAGLFRPFFWEATSALQFIAGVENAVLLLLAGSSLVRLKGDLRSPYRLLVGSVLSLVLILAVLITLSAPNFGTLSRYRAGYMALFLMVVLCGSPVLRYLQRRWVALASQ